jgi:predicted membrane channel-forming protein YqfA (hemolysin III family)
LIAEILDITTTYIAICLCGMQEGNIFWGISPILAITIKICGIIGVAIYLQKNKEPGKIDWIPVGVAALGPVWNFMQLLLYAVIR